MKMTMHIDEALLGRVMRLHGCASKTEAVAFALSELERRHALAAYAKSGLGLAAEELRKGVAADYDVLKTRTPTAGTAYGKRRSRR